MGIKSRLKRDGIEGQFVASSSKRRKSTWSNINGQGAGSAGGAGEVLVACHPPKTLARHSDIRLTLGVYTHLALNDQTAVMQGLPGPTIAAKDAEPVRAAG